MGSVFLYDCVRFVKKRLEIVSSGPIGRSSSADTFWARTAKRHFTVLLPELFQRAEPCQSSPRPSASPINCFAPCPTRTASFFCRTLRRLNLSVTRTLRNPHEPISHAYFPES